MKPTFCLVTEGWIPCLMVDGSRPELGLLETLKLAPHIHEIVDPSPLIVVSLHRLLLAILHRNFGPENTDAWREMWEAGQWDVGKLEAYFDAWQHRFDLFDEERPFYQTPGMPDKLLISVSKLFQERSSGNNATSFDHSLDELPGAIGPGRAANLVVTQQSLSLGGLYGAEAGRAYAKAAPLAGQCSRAYQW